MLVRKGICGGTGMPSPRQLDNYTTVFPLCQLIFFARKNLLSFFCDEKELRRLADYLLTVGARRFGGVRGSPKTSLSSFWGFTEFISCVPIKVRYGDDGEETEEGG